MLNGDTVAPDLILDARDTIGNINTARLSGDYVRVAVGVIEHKAKDGLLLLGTL
jgi:hypothetical protein